MTPLRERLLAEADYTHSLIADTVGERRQYLAEREALLREAADAVPEWRPIESAPKDGTRIAIRFNSGNQREANWQTTYGGEWHVDSFKFLPWSDQADITHWMPLPTQSDPTNG